MSNLIEEQDSEEEEDDGVRGPIKDKEEVYIPDAFKKTRQEKLDDQNFVLTRL